jgi:transcriptional regulator with XRE-family HTH domain
MDIVLKLRELRARAGLTQEEVAKRSGVGVKTLSSFESGARTPTMKLAQLAAIVRVYGLTESSFFSPTLDRELDPWAEPGAAERDQLLRDIETLPPSAQKVIAEKLKLAIELARELHVTLPHGVNTLRRRAVPLSA